MRGENLKDKYSVREVYLKYKVNKKSKIGTIHTSRDVVHLFKGMEKDATEKAIALYLSAKNDVNCYQIIGVGGVMSSTVSISSIIKTLLLSNSSGLILVHNHPSGKAMPSKSDMQFTEKVVDICQLIFGEDVRVLDHVIIGEEGFYSFEEEGKMSNLRKTGNSWKKTLDNITLEV